jgi:hypothetical protein
MDLAALTVPGSVLDGAHHVASVAQDVVIRDDELSDLAGRIEARMVGGTADVETAFGSAGALDRDVNLVFFETACNFYFWSERAEHKWKADVGNEAVGGWYGLAGCFNRAVQRGKPVYEAAWMAALTVERAEEIFAGVGRPIPLIEQRVNNVVEVANYLLQKYDGQALHLVEEAGFSAPKLALTIARELPSFRDGAWYGDKWVWILKRAQILPSDLAQLSAKYPEFKIVDCDQLTAFADYRLPQILRHFGALEYSASLAAVVDTGTILPAASRREVEIRACTIETCERIKKHLPGRTSAEIDLGLWLMSQDMRTDPTLLPHHRTPGCFY